MESTERAYQDEFDLISFRTFSSEMPARVATSFMKSIVALTPIGTTLVNGWPYILESQDAVD